MKCLNIFVFLNVIVNFLFKFNLKFCNGYDLLIVCFIFNIEIDLL